MGADDVNPQIEEAVIEDHCICHRLRGNCVGCDLSLTIYRASITNLIPYLVQRDDSRIVSEMVGYVCYIIDVGAVVVGVFDGAKCLGKVRAHTQREHAKNRYVPLVEKYVGKKMPQWKSMDKETLQQKLTDIADGRATYIPDEKDNQVQECCQRLLHVIY
jgi:hypothetical protein